MKIQDLNKLISELKLNTTSVSVGCDTFGFGLSIYNRWGDFCMSSPDGTQCLRETFDTEDMAIARFLDDLPYYVEGLTRREKSNLKEKIGKYLADNYPEVFSIYNSPKG